MKLKKLIKKTFAYCNVCVVGLRGRGKDMLFGNVIARRKLPYISNTNYHCKKSEFNVLDFNKLDCGRNNYINFINGSFMYYEFPYLDGTDIYISDVGVYLPSQYCDKLNKDFPYFPVFYALSRQLGLCNVHFNVQNLNRAWDKLREQSDIYIYCNSCKVLFKKLVFQTITIYDKYESCVNRVKPFKPINPPLFAMGVSRSNYKVKNMELKRAFDEKNGSVKRRLLVYINKSKYDTRLFKSLLKGEKNV